MQHDDVIWGSLKIGFCAYKRKFGTATTTFCSHPYNLNGLCTHSTCPLANSRYATVIEEGGKIYLLTKTIERLHLPSRTWEKTKLPLNRLAASAVVDKELAWWPSRIVSKCKARHAALNRMLLRMRKMRETEYATGGVPSTVVVKKKEERRLRSRERKAEAAARLHSGIEMELRARLAGGAYDSVVESSAQFASLVDELMAENEAPEEEEEEEIAFESETAETAAPSYVASYGNADGWLDEAPQSKDLDKKRRNRSDPANLGPIPKRRPHVDLGGAATPAGCAAGSVFGSRGKVIIESELENPLMELGTIHDW